MIKIVSLVFLFSMFVNCNNQNFNREYTFNNNEGELVFNEDFTSFVSLDFADQKIIGKRIIRLSFFKTDSVSRLLLLAENFEQEKTDSLVTLGLPIELDSSNSEIDLSTSKKLKEFILMYDNSQLRELNFSETHLQFMNGNYLITELGIFINQEDL